MDETWDLRGILAQNIRNARASLRISQTKLAIYADISLSYMVDIERRRTWVSDKTLKNIAKALNMEAYELLIPHQGKEDPEKDAEALFVQRIAELIGEHKNLLRKSNDEMMEDLKLRVIRLFAEAPPGEPP